MVDLQKFSDGLCKQWGLSAVQIIYSDGLDGRGLYDNLCSPPVIYLDAQFFAYRNHPMVIIAFLHEFRHYWQDMNYHDVLDFWENHPKSYDEHYFDPIVATEYDARAFAWSFGELDAVPLLEAFSELIFSEGDIEKDMEALNSRFSHLVDELNLCRYNDFMGEVLHNVSDFWKDLWFGVRKAESPSHGYSVVEFTWGTAVYDNSRKIWLNAFFRDGSEVILEHSSAVCTDDGISFGGQ